MPTVTNNSVIPNRMMLLANTSDMSRTGYYRPQGKKVMFTVRNSSCGKVMFLQVSFCPHGGRAWLAGGRRVLLERRPLQWTVRIILECILVSETSFWSQVPSRSQVPWPFLGGGRVYTNHGGHESYWTAVFLKISTGDTSLILQPKYRQPVY